jgi:CheY-like chemotaxis protein/two-component sensor histidine kinase
LEAVVDAARRSAGLTRQLLAFARRQRLERRAVDIVGVVDALASTIRDLVGPRIEVTIDHRRPGTVVLADHAGCDQILLNLVSNARDAMPDGGRLAIETGIAPAPDGGPAAGLLVVRDSGVGMTAETAAHMFEPFFTTRVAGTHGVAATGPVGAGTGLGLAIVHGIVEQSGGSIEVESRPGDGTSFRVRLPLAASVDEEQTPAVVGVSARVRGRILVVEDDADVAAFVSTALVGAGHDVRVAPSAEVACDILAAAGPSACPAPFDLVLTDVVMPGMSGWDLADRIRRDSPGTGVVLMSGYARDRGSPQGDRHAWPMLEKPFSIAALGAIVGAALERSSMGAGQASGRG